MKKFFKKHWPLMGIGMLLIVIGFYLIEFQNEMVQMPMLTDHNSGEGIRLKDIHYTQTNPAEGVKWVLDAQGVEFSKDRQSFSFRNFRLKLEPKNSPVIELEGENGDYDKTAGEINLYGDLQGYTDNGYRIISEHVTFKNKEGSLQTDEPVKIIGPFFSADGQGLYFNMERETLIINSNITTLIDKKALVL